MRRHKFAAALKRDLEIQDTPEAAYVGVPHYWAPYYHDGRGPVRPRGGRRFLVWFRDPLKNDPRLKGRFPKVKSEIERLTAAQFADGLRKNRRNPGNPVMIVATVSPFTRPRAKANPFFERAFDKLVKPQEEDAMANLTEEQFVNYLDSKTVFRRNAGYNLPDIRYARTIRVTIGRIA